MSTFIPLAIGSLLIVLAVVECKDYDGSILKARHISLNDLGAKLRRKTSRVILEKENLSRKKREAGDSSIKSGVEPELLQPEGENTSPPSEIEGEPEEESKIGAEANGEDTRAISETEGDSKTEGKANGENESPISETEGDSKVETEAMGTIENKYPPSLSETKGEPEGELAVAKTGAASEAHVENGDPQSETNGKLEEGPEVETEAKSIGADTEAEGASEPEAETEVEAEADAEERPTPYEIIIPPISLMIIIILGLLSLALCSKRKMFINPNLDIKSSSEDDMIRKFELEKIVARHQGRVSPQNHMESDKKQEDKLLTDFDLEVLGSLGAFNSRPIQLLRVSLPALLSLGLCPFTLYLYEPLTSFFWPADKFQALPDINEAIACFLAPAGLVYATSFGFAFQSALTKQQVILDKITHELGLLDQIVTLCSKISLPSLEHRKNIYRAVKSEAIFTTLQIMNATPDRFVHKPCEDVSIKIWDVLDTLKDIAKSYSQSFDIDQILATKIVNHILQLNSICSDRMGIMHARIHPLKWAFLESLGFFSFFGILLIQTQSYRTELTMCIITVFSISLLCFVVSDLDSPFSGFFRVDLSAIPEVVLRIRNAYELAEQGHNILVSYPDTDGKGYD